MKSQLATAAHSNAVARRGDVAIAFCIPIADIQFRSRRFVRELDRYEMLASTGHVGAADDNSAMGSFLPLSKKPARSPSLARE
ncbi:hypothetical protein [Mycobacterium sp. E802]|uniref:hypothetical protein n=1 Tax=Mycobacterium sp. E802 TaxID=1834152 RepID=UPI000AC93F3F|nr:hypothetical protein [Mycobacterium sp. E802]